MYFTISRRSTVSANTSLTNGICPVKPCHEVHYSDNRIKCEHVGSWLGFNIGFQQSFSYIAVVWCSWGCYQYVRTTDIFPNYSLSVAFYAMRMPFLPCFHWQQSAGTDRACSDHILRPYEHVNSTVFVGFLLLFCFFGVFFVFGFFS